jgi:hypothetical protein
MGTDVRRIIAFSEAICQKPYTYLHCCPEEKVPVPFISLMETNYLLHYNAFMRCHGN